MYDVAIIGGGPAGITAAIYCARYRLNVILFCDEFGGQVTKTHKIENYPGFSTISGMELSSHFRKQLDYNNIEIIDKQVEGIKKEKEIFKLNNEIEAKSVILALGMKRRQLNIPGEKEFLGKGVSYCATCDAAFFKDKTVGVIGGNDSAAVAADILSQHASKVSIIYRKAKIRAEPAWIEEMEKNPKIEIIPNTNITEIKGTQMVESVTFDSGKEFKLDGVFIEIGSVPSTALVTSLGVKADEKGYIIIDCAQKTNVEGVFAAGDITTGCNYMRQIVAAASEGAVAAQSIYVWLKKNSN